MGKFTADEWDTLTTYIREKDTENFEKEFSTYPHLAGKIGERMNLFEYITDYLIPFFHYIFPTHILKHR